MTDGYCCIFTKKKNGHRFTDDIASAHNNTFFAVDIDIAAFKKHVINAVESREAELSLPDTLTVKYAAPETVATVTGFVITSFFLEKSLL